MSKTTILDMLILCAGLGIITCAFIPTAYASHLWWLFIVAAWIRFTL